MLDCLEQNNFAGVSAQTFIKSKKMNYLSKCLNLYKKARYYPGERNVIGTPSLFKTSLLKKNNSSLSKIKTQTHIYPVFHTNKQTWYSSILQSFAHKKKVLWTRSGYQKPFYFSVP